MYVARMSRCLVFRSFSLQDNAHFHQPAGTRSSVQYMSKVTHMKPKWGQVALSCRTSVSFLL